MAYDWKDQTAEKCQSDLPSITRSRTEPSRKRLAVPPRQLAVQYRLRRHGPHHQGRMLSLEQPRRTPQYHPIHRAQKMGSYRSNRITVGITLASAGSDRFRGLCLPILSRTTWHTSYRRRTSKPSVSGLHTGPGDWRNPLELRPRRRTDCHSQRADERQ